jgi:peptidoglycan/LPS O-acetylase OafA/YrhL
MMHPLSDPPWLARYVLRRTFRIWVPLSLAIGGAFLLYAGSPADTGRWKSFDDVFTYNILLGSPPRSPSYFTPGLWSLRPQVAFLAVFPLCALLQRHFPGAFLWAITAAAFAFKMLYTSPDLRADLPHPERWANLNHGTIDRVRGYSDLISRIEDFGWGMAAAHVVVNAQNASRTTGTSVSRRLCLLIRRPLLLVRGQRAVFFALFVLGCGAILFNLIFLGMLTSTPFFPIGTLCMAVGNAVLFVGLNDVTSEEAEEAEEAEVGTEGGMVGGGCRCPVGSVLGNAWLGQVGRLQYSIYLVHQIYMAHWYRVFEETRGGSPPAGGTGRMPWALLWVVVQLSVACAAFFVVVEQGLSAKGAYAVESAVTSVVTSVLARARGRVLGGHQRKMKQQ